MIGRTISHYRIIAKLGEGGMGVVYQAEDLNLGRQVALKFLSPHRTADSEAKRRFVHEAKAAATLDHSGICTVHEVAEADGQLFIAMALLEGETLKERIGKGPLPIPEVLEIASQVADALHEAHGKGVTHRDIKPANVMLTPRGQTKVMDFGLAQVAGSSHLTQAGSTLGTAAYMSPEQARGDAVDLRTDIWSLGVVLYEMVSGRRPFQGEHEAALLYGIQHIDPEPLTGLRTGVPLELEKVVDKCLEKNREVRYQSARDLLVDLKRLSREREAGWAGAPGVGATPRVPSLAVLPFTNLSADKENEYFSDGLTEDIIDALAQVPGLRVMARTSAFAFRDREVDVREIGARLNVEHILEGSVRRAGNRLRVTAQLVKASDGYHLWSQRFDREMTDVFAIQDEISQAIVEKLRVRLVADRPLVKRYTENIAAYDICLKGRSNLFKLTQEGYEAARVYCEQAIALDPDYALAYAVLCEVHWAAAFWGFLAPREALPRAKSAALEALRLDDTIAETHSVLGAVLGTGDYDWPAAKREFRRALELNPSSAEVRYYYAHWYLLPLGQVEQSLTEIRRALELDPLDPFYNTHAGYGLHVMRQFEPAIAQLQRAVDLGPTYWYPYWWLSISCALSGRSNEAVAAAEKARELSGGNALALGMLGRAYALAGRTAEARQLLEELEVRRRSRYVPPSSIAMIYRGLGDLQKGLEWWTLGVEEHDLVLVLSLKSEPSYDAMRSHPAYQALLRKMNLEP